MKTLNTYQEPIQQLYEKRGGGGGCRRHILQWFSYKIVPKLLIKGGGGCLWAPLSKSARGRIQSYMF